MQGFHAAISAADDEWADAEPGRHPSIPAG
jgi:hypothetical protein